MTNSRAVAIVLAAIGLSFVSHDVHARGVIGNSSGVWWWPNHLNCFAEYYGETRTVSGSNTDLTCTDGRLLNNLYVPTSLPLDTGNNYHNIYWETDGGNRGVGSAIQCMAYSFNANISYYSTSLHPTDPNGAQFQTQPAMIYAANWGNLESVCYLPLRNQGLVTVTYDP